MAYNIKDNAYFKFKLDKEEEEKQKRAAQQRRATNQDAREQQPVYGPAVPSTPAKQQYPTLQNNPITKAYEKNKKGTQSLLDTLMEDTGINPRKKETKIGLTNPEKVSASSTVRNIMLRQAETSPIVRSALRNAGVKDPLLDIYDTREKKAQNEKKIEPLAKYTPIQRIYGGLSDVSKRKLEETFKEIDSSSLTFNQKQKLKEEAARKIYPQQLAPFVRNDSNRVDEIRNKYGKLNSPAEVIETIEAYDNAYLEIRDIITGGTGREINREAVKEISPDQLDFYDNYANERQALVQRLNDMEEAARLKENLKNYSDYMGYVRSKDQKETKETNFGKPFSGFDEKGNMKFGSDYHSIKTGNPLIDNFLMKGGKTKEEIANQEYQNALYINSYYENELKTFLKVLEDMETDEEFAISISNKYYTDEDYKKWWDKKAKLLKEYEEISNKLQKNIETARIEVIKKNQYSDEEKLKRKAFGIVDFSEAAKRGKEKAKRDNNLIFEADGKTIDFSPEEGRKQIAQLMFTDTEKDTFYALYDKNPSEAIEYYNLLFKKYNDDVYNENIDTIVKTMEKDPIIHGLGMAATTLIKPAESFVNVVTGGGLENTPIADIDRRLKDDNTKGIQAQLGEDVGKYVAGAGHSIGEMLGAMINAKMIGLDPQKKALDIMSMGAASSGMKDAKDRGGNKAQIIASGLAQGGAERLLGMIGTDKIFNMIGKSSQSILKELVKSAGGEFTEEFLTEAANALSDMLIMGDKSHYNIVKQSFINEGMDEEQAKEETLKQLLLQQPMEAGITGAISGGVMGGGNAFISTYAEGKNALTKAPEFQKLTEDITKMDVSDLTGDAAKLQDAVKTYVEKSENAKTKFGQIINAGKAVAAASEYHGTPKVIVTEDISKEDRAKLNKFSKAANVNIIYSSIDQDLSTDYKGGFYVPDTNTIVIDKGTSVIDILDKTAAHEVGHTAEGTRWYDAYKRRVIADINESGSFNTEVQNKMDFYRENGVDLSFEKAEAEVIADYTSNLINDHSLIDKMVKRDYNTANLFLDGLRDVYNNLKSKVTGKEIGGVEETVRYLERALGMRNQDLTNSGDVRYNISNEKGDVLYGERSEEFRRIQEESQRMSYEDTQSYHSGSRQIDDNVRRRLSRVFQRELGSQRSSVGDDNGVLILTDKKTGNAFKMYKNTNGKLFRDIFEISKQYLENGELVDVHSTETNEDGIGYNDCTNYISTDGLSGFSITPDGDLISVFNLNDKKGFLRAISQVVKKDAKTLDCYNSPKQPLMEMYKKVFGFKTASLMDYNMDFDHDNIAETHGMPQIAFMVNTDEDVETKHFNKDEYDEAVEYQQSFINPKYSIQNLTPEQQKAIDDDRAVSQFYKNTLNNEMNMLTDEVREGLNEEDFLYEVKSNAQNYAEAKAYVNEMGFDKAKEALEDKFRRAIPLTSNEVAQCGYIVSQLQQQKRTSDAVNFIIDMRASLTEGGRATQIISLFNRLTPGGQLLYLNKTAQKITDTEIDRNLKGKRREAFDKEFKEAKKKDAEIKKRLDTIIKNYEDMGDVAALMELSPEEFKSRMSEMRKDIEGINEEVKKKSNKITEATDTLRELESERDNLKKEKSKYETIQKRIAQLEDKIAKLDSEIADFDDKRKLLESYREVRDILKKDKSKYETVIERIGKVEQKIDEIKEQIADFESRRSELEEKRKKMTMFGKELYKLKKEFKLTNTEEVYKKYKIDFLSKKDQEFYAEALKVLDEIESPGELIKFIKAQNERRGITFSTSLLRNLEKAVKRGQIAYLKETALLQIMRSVDDMAKTSTFAKLMAWRMQSMLSGLPTFMRNIGSNTGFGAQESLVTNLAMPGDILISAFTKQRSISWDNFGLGKGQLRAMNDARRESAIAIETDTQRGNNKYELGRKAAFKNRGFAAFERHSAHALQDIDQWNEGGIKLNVTKQLERLRKANKLDITDEEIAEIAQETANYRLFKDENLVNNIISGIKTQLNKVGIKDKTGATVLGLGDFVAPFVMVPGAIVCRTIEYTPFGYLKAIKNLVDLAKARGDDVSAQRNLALATTRATTGAGLITLFTWLSSLGLIVGDKKDDTEEKKMQNITKSQGFTGYQLNGSALIRFVTAIVKQEDLKSACTPKDGDFLVKFDFFQPLANNMAVGYGLYEAVKEAEENGEDVNFGKFIFDASVITMAKFFDQIEETSGFSFVKRIFDDSLDETDTILTIGADVLTSFLPRQVSQIARMMDTKQRSAYLEKDPWKKFGYMVADDIPGLRSKVPAKTSHFGEELDSSLGNPVADFFNIFINPGTTNKYKTDKITDEVIRVYEATKESAMLPTDLNKAKEISFNRGVKQEVDGWQLNEYAQTIGKALAENYSEFINSEEYQKLTDAERAESFRKIKNGVESKYKTDFAIKNKIYKDSMTSDSAYIEGEKGLLEAKTIINPKDAKTRYGYEAYNSALSLINGAEKNNKLTPKIAEKLRNVAQQKSKEMPKIMEIIAENGYSAGAYNPLNMNYARAFSWTENGVNYELPMTETALISVIEFLDKYVPQSYESLYYNGYWTEGGKTSAPRLGEVTINEKGDMGDATWDNMSPQQRNKKLSEYRRREIEYIRGVLIEKFKQKGLEPTKVSTVWDVEGDEEE